jgi:hypothetical protein
MRSTVAGIFACVVALGGAAFCVSAYGEVGVPTGTVQQVGADALFEEYAPAPPTPGIICLVDSGVDANPDTTPILAGSYALSSNTNTEDELAALYPSLPGGHPDGHGTYMAMIAAAPADAGWGMVGFAPSSVRVYNLKALAAGQTTFSFAEYAVAISRCQALSSSMPITVVNLSLGSGTQPTGSEMEALENYIQSANAHGISVIAAAGNEDGPVQAPASLPGVLGVGADDASRATPGATCPFTNRGTGLSLFAPGCDSETQGIEIAFADDGAPAWTEGTSEATVIVSAAEASMRAYSPTITATQAQGCITSTLTNSGNLDVEAAFDACGLGAIVSEGMAAYRAANSTPSTPSTPSASTGPSAATLPPETASAVTKPKSAKPKIIRITFKDHRLTISVATVPRGLRLHLTVQERDRAGHLLTVALVTTTHDTYTMRVAGWNRVVASFLEGHTQLPAVVVTRANQAAKRGVR